jgi:YD repeat-containing protein
MSTVVTVYKIGNGPTTGFAGSTANTYTYDYANRLTSWNNGTTTTNYGYDASGNRIQVGANVYTYDARDPVPDPRPPGTETRHPHRPGRADLPRPAPHRLPVLCAGLGRQAEPEPSGQGPPAALLRDR